MNQKIALSPEAANIADIYVQSLADSLENIHANRIAVQNRFAGAFAEPGQSSELNYFDRWTALIATFALVLYK